jgi:hypothetical protein
MSNICIILLFIIALLLQILTVMLYDSSGNLNLWTLVYSRLLLYSLLFDWEEKWDDTQENSLRLSFIDNHRLFVWL